MSFFPEIIFSFVYFFLFRFFGKNEEENLKNLEKYLKSLRINQEKAFPSSKDEEKIYKIWKETRLLSYNSMLKLRFLEKILRKITSFYRRKRQMNLGLFFRIILFISFCFLLVLFLKIFFVKSNPPPFFEKEQIFYFCGGYFFVFLICFAFKKQAVKSSFFYETISHDLFLWLELYFLGQAVSGNEFELFFAKEGKNALMTGALYEEDGKNFLENWIFEQIDTDVLEQEKSFDFYPLYELFIYTGVFVFFFLPFLLNWSFFLSP